MFRIMKTESDIVCTDFPGSRRPIPVSTIDWRTTHLSQFTPIQGLDFLIGAEQVYIQQTVELNDCNVNKIIIFTIIHNYSRCNLKYFHCQFRT